MESKSHEDFYWRTFYLTEHATERRWQFGTGMRIKLGWQSTSICTFVESMKIYGTIAIIFLLIHIFRRNSSLRWAIRRKSFQI
jgi:hypothetical protein